MNDERRLSVWTAALLVVASMIGTGVFTTTGFLVRDLRSAPAVLVAWLLGGVAALFGALAYGELVSALPRNGGEYALLRRIYHPAVGFVAGFVSLFVGFAAPIAASAIAFGKYLDRVFPGGPSWWPPLAGVGLVAATSVLHVAHLKRGTRFQDATTTLKIGFVLAFVFGAFVGGDGVDLSRLGAAERPFGDALFSPELAVGLVFVSFAYTGWNAAAYVAGETEAPERNLPRALALGTAVVTLLYLALNLVFLAAVPASSLAGEVEVGHIAAEALFGETAGRVLSAIIAAGLVSTVGAMVFTGPRIYEAMGQDFPALRVLTHRGEGGPVWSTLLQAVVAIAMALSAHFDQLLIYAGVTLSLSAALTAAGVFVLRIREPALPRPYRAWGHPVTTLVFLGLTIWMMVHSVVERPIVTAFASGTIALGLLCWLLVRAPVERRP